MIDGRAGDWFRLVWWRATKHHRDGRQRTHDDSSKILLWFFVSFTFAEVPTSHEVTHCDATGRERKGSIGRGFEEVFHVVGPETKQGPFSKLFRPGIQRMAVYMVHGCPTNLEMGRIGRPIED